jgi:SAM-dependent methyltransferase
MAYRVRECPLCGGANFTPLLTAGDFHYGNPGKYHLTECSNCSLAFLDPMCDDAELAAFYPTDYYAFSDRFAKPTNRLRFFVRNLLLGPKEHATRDPEFERPGRMLDVGCGSGWFMSTMRDRGWQVQGVEPNAAAAAFGRTEKGLDIHAGSLLDAAFPDRSFDYIRLNHSFEHMNNPNRIIEELHRILADDGKLMIGVPDRSGWNARIFGPYWWHLALPLHAFSYSAETLSRMLAKHAFRVQTVVHNTEQGAIVGSLLLFRNRKDPSQAPLDGWIPNSLALKVVCTWLARLQNMLGVADVVEITATKVPRSGTRP